MVTVNGRLYVVGGLAGGEIVPFCPALTSHLPLATTSVSVRLGSKALLTEYSVLFEGQFRLC